MIAPTLKRLPLSPLRLVALVTLACAWLAAVPAGAQAQQVLVIVNGDPITAYDVEQRMKLSQLSGQKTTDRQATIQELIDEKIKIQLLKRFMIEGMDQDVENAYANMARRMRTTAAGFTEQLAKSGINSSTLKHRIRAEITWNQIVRGRFQSSLQISDKDVLAKMETNKPDESKMVGYDYTLRPIVFIIPRGSPPTLVEARTKEAEALKARFENCDQGVALARTLRDVAVRAPIVKSSTELAPELRAILDKTEIGKLSAPEQTTQGIEIYALCAKKQSAADNTPGRKEVRDELYSEQFKTLSARYLKELRSQAMIEYKQQ
jgi:peptidyl-prolyl cis-trans isomerase SurA